MTATVGEEDLASLRDSLRSFLTRHSSSAEVREQMETVDGFDPAVWSALADQLGVQAMTIPEEFGGLGYGPTEQAVVIAEAGRALLCAPLLSSTVAATDVLLRVGTDADQRELFPGLAKGETRATVAFGERTWRQGMVAPETHAIPVRQEWLLTGGKSLVLDGATATMFLVTAATENGLSLFTVDGDAPGVTRTSLAVLDLTRKQADVDFCDAPARLVGQEGAVAAGIGQALDLTTAAIAVEQAAAAGQCLDMVVSYLKVREQFGRLLGSFQALKHRCANLFVKVEAARSIAASAVDAAAAQDWDDLALLAPLAKASCSDVAAEASAECVQLHGGIGFTWEHDAHLYFKRARGTQYLFGTPTHERTRAADVLGL